jgi:hypothetical protein
VDIGLNTIPFMGASSVIAPDTSNVAENPEDILNDINKLSLNTILKY